MKRGVVFVFLAVLILSLFLVSASCSGDFNNDGKVDNVDYSLFSVNLNANFNQPATEVNKMYDLNSDGIINSEDYVVFAGLYGKTCSEIENSVSAEEEDVASNIRVPEEFRAEIIGGLKVRLSWTDLQENSGALATGNIVKKFLTGLVTGFGIFQSLSTGSNCIADFNSDGVVDSGDYSLFQAQYGKPVTEANSKYDLDNDGDTIDFDDYLIFSQNFGQTCSGDSNQNESANDAGEDVNETSESGVSDLTENETGSANASLSGESESVSVSDFPSNESSGAGNVPADVGIFYSIERNGQSIGVFSRAEVCKGGKCVYEDSLEEVSAIRLSYRIRTCLDSEGKSCGSFSEPVSVLIKAGKPTVSEISSDFDGDG